MAGTFTWLSLATALQQLALRLADPNNSFWSQAELTVYLQQSLRQYNSLTWYWRKDFQFSSTNLWNSLGSLTGSPRIRTLTDTYAYTELEYMLLEPATGGTWTGTTQFTIADLSQALQRRRDEMLQISNCNQSLMEDIPLTPNTIRTYLPDTVIDVPRVRYLTPTLPVGYGQGGFGQGGFGGSPPSLYAVTLYRDDTVANEFYEQPINQLTAGTPSSFSLSSEPPLSWDVDIPPNQAGEYEAVVLQSGAPFAPPASDAHQHP